MKLGAIHFVILTGSVSGFVPVTAPASTTCVVLPHPFAMLRKPLSLCSSSNYVIRRVKTGYSRSSCIKMMIDVMTEQQIFQQGILTSIFAALALGGIAAEKDMLSRKELQRTLTDDQSLNTHLYSDLDADEFDPSAPMEPSCFMIPTPPTAMAEEGVRAIGRAHSCTFMHTHSHTHTHNAHVAASRVRRTHVSATGGSAPAVPRSRDPTSARKSGMMARCTWLARCRGRAAACDADRVDVPWRRDVAHALCPIVWHSDVRSSVWQLTYSRQPWGLFCGERERERARSMSKQGV